MKAYFSHDEGARNDPKLVKVLMRLGQAGKGVYWDLVEMLYEQGGYLPLAEVESYAFALRTDPDLITKLINDFGLFATDAERFWSETALERLQMRSAKAEARAQAGAKGGKAKAEREAIAKALLEQDHSIASPDSSNATALPAEKLAIKGKEIKGKPTNVGGGGATAPAAEPSPLKAEKAKKEKSVAAHTDPDDLQDVAHSPLHKPEAFAAILKATGYPDLDVERYRSQIAAKSEGVERTASQWRSRIIEFVNNDYTAGKLMTYPKQTPNEVPSNWDQAKPYVAPVGQGIPSMNSILKPEFQIR